MAFQLVAMTVGNNGGGTCNVTPNARNDGVGVWDTTTDIGNDVLGVWTIPMDIGNSGVLARSVLISVRNGWTFVYPKFSLEVESQQWSCRGGGTHVKDAKNPVEVRPPVGDCLFIVLRVITSRDHVPFTPLNDVPLDLVHGPN